MIAIVDYGVGNLRSVERALLHVGAEPLITSDPGQLERASGIVLPGVGAFAPAKKKLSEGGLGREVVGLARNGKPVLGVCLGYQLLFEESEEGGRHEGLGLLPGRVVAVEGSEHVPVIGWCRVRQIASSPIWSGIPDGAYFYFVHSYYPVVAGTSSQGSTVGGLPEDRGAPVPRMSPGTVHVAWCEYGIEFAAAIERGLIYATQFHPEKSQRWGLRLLENFAAIVKGGAR